MKELRVARSAGFCFGVRRSVELAEELMERSGPSASLGQLIHNEDVVAALEKKACMLLIPPSRQRLGNLCLSVPTASREQYMPGWKRPARRLQMPPARR